MHCAAACASGMVQGMNRYLPSPKAIGLSCSLFVASAISLAEAPSPGALAAFNVYIITVEERLVRQHQTPAGFLAIPPQLSAQLHGGQPIVEQLTPAAGISLPGAMLHHWRGTAFVPGATVKDFELLMKDFSAYPQRFSPQVERTVVLAQHGDHLQVFMRVRQKHVITVVMDARYDVLFRQLDRRHGYSISRSSSIAEIDSPGTAKEHPLSAAEEHGFLWRQNSYWSYEERDGGLYMQIESVSLSRAIPTGLGWAVRPFVESVPRESMEFTLQATCNALKGRR